MKKIISLLTVLFVTVVALNGCATKEDKVIKVASHINPMPKMLELIQEDVAEKGYTLEIVSVNDNVQANAGLLNKEFDANFFQHAPYMMMFNEQNNGNLVAVQPIYDAIVGFYSKDLASIDHLSDEAVIAIPNDPTNEARALRLLAQANLITLKDGVGYKANTEDIIDNPKNLEFLKVGLLNLNSAYEETDMVFNYPAYIGKIGLTPMEDALILEEGDRHFAIQLVAREDNKDSQGIQILKEALTNQKIADFIESELKGVTVKAFEVSN